jgi:hypothetical protein
VVVNLVNPVNCNDGLQTFERGSDVSHGICAASPISHPSACLQIQYPEGTTRITACTYWLDAFHKTWRAIAINVAVLAIS